MEIFFCFVIFIFFISCASLLIPFLTMLYIYKKKLLVISQESFDAIESHTLQNVCCSLISMIPFREKSHALQLYLSTRQIWSHGFILTMRRALS